ncbi:hypothetical protein J6590_041118 [Homalodisca vitripennis]|nr:hypothetical protein J6590_041118 [Homalodisca vitripennis]
MNTRSRNNLEAETNMANTIENEEESLCGKCNVPVSNEMAMGCDGFCQLWYHPYCVDIDNEMYAVINYIAVKVKWYCEACNNKLKMLIRKSSKVDDRCRSTNHNVTNNIESSIASSTLCHTDRSQQTKPDAVNTTATRSNNITYSRVVRNSALGAKMGGNGTVSKNNDSDKDFVVYISRRRKSAIKHAQERDNSGDTTYQEKATARPIVGIKTGGSSKLKIASRRSWVFVSRLDTSVAKEILKHT